MSLFLLLFEVDLLGDQEPHACLVDRENQLVLYLQFDQLYREDQACRQHQFLHVLRADLLGRYLLLVQLDREDLLLLVFLQDLVRPS